MNDRDFTFTYDEAIKGVRSEIIENGGLVEGLGNEWRFDDLNVSWQIEAFTI